MTIVLGILAAMGLGGIIYLFLSKQSSHILKLTALGALIVIGLAVVVCSVLLIFSGGGEKYDPYAFPLILDEQPQPKGSSNLFQVTIFIIFSFLILGIILYIGIRQHKRQSTEKPGGKNGNSTSASGLIDDSDFTFE